MFERAPAAEGFSVLSSLLKQRVIIRSCWIQYEIGFGICDDDDDDEGITSQYEVGT